MELSIKKVCPGFAALGLGLEQVLGMEPKVTVSDGVQSGAETALWAIPGLPPQPHTC